MPALKKYPDELRERAIRFALDLVNGPKKLSVNAASKRVGEQLGIVPACAFLLLVLSGLGRAPFERRRHSHEFRRRASCLSWPVAVLTAMALELLMPI